MIIKNGVDLSCLKVQILLALVIASEIYKEHKHELVITSACDSEHKKASLHYVGFAVDLRTYFFKDREDEKVRDEIKEKLGEQYDVVLEKDHIHIEYQPKK